MMEVVWQLGPNDLEKHSEARVGTSVSRYCHLRLLSISVTLLYEE